MKIALLIFVSSLVLSSFSYEFMHMKQMFKAGGDLPTVDKVDIEKFSGHWYEIARLPHKGEKKCLCSQEEVILKDDRIIANNTCIKESIFGEQDVEEFEMVPLDDTYAKFKTDVIADYYIIALDEDNYQYAMIGDPSRDFLWISARQPILEKNRLFALVKQAKDLGFDVDKLIYQAQICGDIFEEGMQFSQQAQAIRESHEEEEENLPTVDQVDLNKFAGHWYEIARLPNKAERGCLCPQEFLEVQGSKLYAKASCRKDTIDADVETCETYFIPEDETNAKLKIQDKDYELYVIDLDEDNYEYALVGDPERRFLWIKSREQLVDYDVLKKLIDKARDLGFDVDKLVYPVQLCGNDLEAQA